MNNLNYITGIIKILETPKERRVKKNNLFITEFRAQFPQLRGSQIITLTFWGNLAKDILVYYKVNDYLMIEGYIFLNEDNNLNFKSKNVAITVLKSYPFLLNYNRLLTKT